MVRIKLSSGKVIEAERDGDIFVCGGDVAREDFAGKLNGATVTDEDGTEILGGVLMIEAFFKDGGKSCVWLSEVKGERLTLMKAEANLEYIAMMTGVEI